MKRVLGHLALLSFAASMTLTALPVKADEHSDGHHEGTIDGESTPADRVQIHPMFNAAAVDAGMVKVAFHLYDKTLKQTLDAESVDITHAAKVHVIIYDASLQEYRHVHPSFQNGMWEVDVPLVQDGNYHLWTQGKVKADGGLWSTALEFTVVNGEAAHPQIENLPSVLSGVDGISQVTLSNETLVVADASTFTLSFSRLDGTFPELSPYLGALAHLLIVDSQGDQLVHAHPVEGYGDKMQVTAWFPHAGSYRLWVEFNDGDFHRIVPLSIIVN